MNSKIKLSLLTILSFMTLDATAKISLHPLEGKDPISWQLSGTLPSTIAPGSSASVIYTFTNQLPFQLVNPIVIEKNGSPASDFTYSDNCTGVRLTPQQSCSVQATMTPITAGAKSLQLVISGYDKNRVPLPMLTSQAVSPTPTPTSSNIIAQVSQSLPGTLTVGTPANYAFKFTNAGTSTVTGVSTQSSDANFATTCTTSLAAGRYCSVTGSYTPPGINPSVQTVSATFNYAQGNPVTVSTSTNVPTATGVVGSLVTPFYLPAVMVGGAPNAKTIIFLFTNYETPTVTVTSNNVNITVGSGATFTPGTNPGDNSCNGSPQLTTGSACQIKGTFTAPTEVSATPFSVQATINYSGGTGSSSNATTSTTVVSSISTSRTVNFVNNCGFNIWFSLNGSALAGSPDCSSDPSVCPTGTACRHSTATCYWNNYAPTNNIFELASGGGTNSVTIPLTSADPAVQWSGNFSGSTGCNGTSSCTQADCGNNGGSTSCSPGMGFSQPATQAEVTMNIASADSYDVEVINGFHVPMSMAPDATVTASNFSCGAPGSAVAGNGFGACNWNGVTLGDLPNTEYYWVTNGGGTCGSCPGGQLCGLDSALDQVCGDFLGYWSADQACSVNATKANPYFNCNTPLSTTSPAFPAGSVLQQLMACAVPTGYTGPNFNSCYQTYPNGTVVNTCCGCVDWWTVGGIGANDTAQSCTKPGAGSPQTDPTWNSSVQTLIQWAKTACPSMYTYPFDDATSGFSCTNNLPGSSNSVGYTVTFCPENGASQPDTGLPSGITDGR